MTTAAHAMPISSRTVRAVNATIDAACYISILVIAALAVMGLAYGTMLAEVELANAAQITEPLPR